MGTSTSRPQTPRLFSPHMRITSRRRSSTSSATPSSSSRGPSPLSGTPVTSSPMPSKLKFTPRDSTIMEEQQPQDDALLADVAKAVGGPSVKPSRPDWLDLTTEERQVKFASMTSPAPIQIDTEHVLASTIPPEIIHLVLSYLDVESLASVQLLGRFWYSMADDEGLWRGALQAETAQWNYSNMPPISFGQPHESASYWKHLYVTYLYKMDRQCDLCRYRFSLINNTRTCDTHTGKREFVTRIGAPSGMYWTCCMKSEFNASCISRCHDGKIGNAPAPKLRVQALFDYDSDDDIELSFSAGETLFVLVQEESGWWLAQNQHGDQGLIPSAYVQEIPDT
eukprot:TRINITY_DN660_c0_g1_i1.p1 TRINITY_DN660_c0_g1~~TRINITY_DN660_c0_g1_i1.p1  ORF type:complete len:338 (+),score=53.35 TRINITY_DN660_c0_g1_i1:106-1119(+)